MRGHKKFQKGPGISACIFFMSSPVYPDSMNAAAYYFVNGMESEANAIARGLRRRDPDLLDRLIEQYQHRLLRYLVYLTGNRELAEDLFQETWIRVLERGHQYDGKHEFSTWLYAVARNLTIDFLRKRSPVSLNGLMEDEEHASLEPADTRPLAWEVVAQHEQARRINAALVSIPAEYREAVVLRFHEGLGLEEIATVTEARLGTVKSRLYRGLNLLMSRLEGCRHDAERT
jgi:RNA polymerase sigma-70 factor (ECF subfamily)